MIEVVWLKSAESKMISREKLNLIHALNCEKRCGANEYERSFHICQIKIQPHHESRLDPAIIYVQTSTHAVNRLTATSQALKANMQNKLFCSTTLISTGEV